MLLPFVQRHWTKEHLKGQHQWLQQCAWKYCRAFHTEGTVREIRPWNSSLLALCTSQAVCRQPWGKSSAQEKTGDSQLLLKQKNLFKKIQLNFCAFHLSRPQPCPEMQSLSGEKPAHPARWVPRSPPAKWQGASGSGNVTGNGTWLGTHCLAQLLLELSSYV